MDNAELNIELTAEQIASATIVVVDDEPLITQTLSNFLFV